ncbi:MFS general substrate transporter [Apiospora phragmitis]|uniref:MFS general substrate transporter n=1 Tax=Apiospora phragmitis TaxID=2905665 RepID=A0ABR1SV18_9PEZI
MSITPEKTSVGALEAETANKSDSETYEISWTREEEAVIRHKLDWQIVPVVTVLYLLCFLDRANIGNARIQGMEKELDLKRDNRFNIATSIFYIVYLTVEIPSNLLLKKIGPRFYIPGLVVSFGLVSMMTAFVTTYEQLCGLRALLGIFEGGAMPGIAFFLSNFYKREELYFRVGIYVSAASMAGLLATALARVPEWGTAAAPIHTWRNIFFFEGLLTMACGLLAPLLLPQTPAQSKRLNEREKWIAEERLRLEHKALLNEKVRPHHVKRAMLNINNYICAGGFFFINVTVQGISVFMPTVLLNLGWKAEKAQLYSVPPYVLASAVAIAISFRGIYLALFTLVGITGFAVLRWSTSDNIKYMGIYFVAIGAFPGGPGFLSWGLNNSAGPAVRAVTGGWIVSLGTMGGILAVWAYLSTDGPNFPIGHTINLVCQVCTLFLALGGIFYCNWEKPPGKTAEEIADLGYRHPEFRYMA